MAHLVSRGEYIVVWISDKVYSTGNRFISSIFIYSFIHSFIHSLTRSFKFALIQQISEEVACKNERQEAQLMLTNLRDAFVGQSMSPNIVPFHMLHIVSYCAIVTLSLRPAVFMIFDFKNVVTLKSGSEVAPGHWKWYHSIDRVWFSISAL